MKMLWDTSQITEILCPLNNARNQIMFIDFAVSVAGSFSQSMTELCPMFCSMFYVCRQKQKCMYASFYSRIC